MGGMGCGCSLGILKFTGAQVNFPQSSVTFENLNETQEKVIEKVKIKWEDSTL